MPKSKVRKKAPAGSSAVGRTASPDGSLRAKVAAPSSPLYMGIMLGLFVLGLIWLVTFYLWGDRISFLGGLGSWNYAISFGLLIAGLIMTMRWR
jgi:Cell division protein CrgA